MGATARVAALLTSLVPVGCGFWGAPVHHAREKSPYTYPHAQNPGPPVYAAAPGGEEQGTWERVQDEALHAGSTANRETAHLGFADNPSRLEPSLEVNAPSDDVEDEVLEDEEGDDPLDAPHYAAPARTAPAKPHPLAELSAVELRRRLEREPGSLGPMSVGAPNGGALINAVQLPEDARWDRVAPGSAWGTQETIDYLSSAIGRVVEQYPDSLPVAIGHISDRDGGPLRPHRSHQSGADVDVGFYYKPEAHKWYQRATKDNLDLPRTWALVRALITETDARMILVDHSVQAWLREHAESIGENRAWLDDIFGVKGSLRPALIRHAPGHATHLHVRFYNPIAEETARRCHGDLVALGKVKVQPSFVSYKARKGDTLLALAKRFGTTVKAIKRANALRTNTILAKRVYRIPSSSKPKITMGRAQAVPPRRLPPVQASTQSLSQL